MKVPPLGPAILAKGGSKQKTYPPILLLLSCQFQFRFRNRKANDIFRVYPERGLLDMLPGGRVNIGSK